MLSASRALAAALVTAALLGSAMVACSRTTPPAHTAADAIANTSTSAAGSAAAAGAGCLADGSGYVHATLRGAIDTMLDWRNGEITCEGSPRPDGAGMRLSLLGPKSADGRQLRLVLGLARTEAGPAAVPANVTVIIEGGGLLYSTRGDEHCSVEKLERIPLGGSGTTSSGAEGDFKVSGRGYCVDPASTLDGSARLYIDRFDFSARMSATAPAGAGADSGTGAETAAGAPRG